MIGNRTFAIFVVLFTLNGCGSSSSYVVDNKGDRNLSPDLCKEIELQRATDLRDVESAYIPVDQELVDVVPVACAGNVKLSIRRDSAADFTKIQQLYMKSVADLRKSHRLATVAKFSGKLYYTNGTISIAVTGISDEKLQVRTK